jgi:hypothetical protein
MIRILVPLEMDKENRTWLKTKELKKQLKPKTKETKKSIFSIAKTYEDKKQVFGWGLISADWEFINNKWQLKKLIDHQLDTIDESELEKMAYTFVLKYRDSGVMHESDKKIIGKCIESMCWTLEKQMAMNIPEGLIPIGWWLGFQITDDSVWARVKNGELPDFSIEGMATREEENVDETLYKVAKGKHKTFFDIVKFNPNHEPAGSPIGGRFTSSDGNRDINLAIKNVCKKIKNDTLENMIILDSQTNKQIYETKGKEHEVAFDLASAVNNYLIHNHPGVHEEYRMYFDTLSDMDFNACALSNAKGITAISKNNNKLYSLTFPDNFWNNKYFTNHTISLIEEPFNLLVMQLKEDFYNARKEMKANIGEEAFKKESTKLYDLKKSEYDKKLSEFWQEKSFTYGFKYNESQL